MAEKNDLNLLLKAKVIKLKVELDYKGSKLPEQVDGISKKLEKKPVKLKVKLEATVKDLNKQISDIHKKINESKTTKAPIKIAVQIDVHGSAKNIKKQLDEVYKTVEKFNKQYGKQIEQMQQKTQQASKNVASNIGSSASAFGGMINPTTYMNSLKEAEKYMKTTFGKGLFSSQELKNANGDLVGFTTTLSKANGVVQKIRYDWDANSNKFTPINQQTVTQTEKNVSKSLASLRELDREIAKLGTNQNKYWQEYQELSAKSANGTLTQEAVNGLKARIKDEQVLQTAIKTENNLLREQKELLAQINRFQKSTKDNKTKSELGNLKTNLSNVNLDDTMAKNQIAGIKSGLESIKTSYNDNIKKEKDLRTASEKRLDILSKIEKIEKSNIATSSGATSNRYMAETKILAKNIKTMEDYNAVLKRVSSTNRGFESIKLDNDIEKQLAKLKNAMFSYATATGKSLHAIEARYEGVAHAVKQNLGLATSEVAKYERFLSDFRNKQSAQEKVNSIVQLSPDKAQNKKEHERVNNFVNDKDNEALKQYISSLNNAEVSMMRVTNAGNGVSRITAQFASTKKTAKEVTYEISNVDKQLRQLSTAEVFNANRNLGVFEQLKIAIARVPVWMMAMTAFYGSIRSVKAMTNEILELDKALTELRRVADAQINIDSIFTGAIDLSKELGNNIHNVMQSVNDLARTFGDFNERQLLSITRTATLMSNVSDLTAQEATESLIGTMNAFNITAEESIRIVDSMNEVDNNYAISTKQLATGLAKSASTARTFGVEMEENIGHITAIGAVTMESGNIIGNSLKTIYSRITTVKGAKDILDSVGISVYDMTGKIKPASGIIEELALKWRDLTDEQRQNIGVQVAGRYQLSRFLALMNNYQMATKATQTALNSQGSAIRENAQYMKSFEARINQLKNGFTELSNAVGEAFLSSGLSIGISALTSLANVAVKVIDSFGALPTLFGLITIALLKFGVFNKLTASIAGGLTRIGTSITSVTAQTTLMGATTTRVTAGAKASWAMMGAGVQVVAGKITASASAMFLAIKTGFTSMLASTGIGIAFVALGFAIEWVVKKFSDQKAEQEEVIKTNEKMVESYRKTGDGMQSMFNEYSKLSEMKKNNIALSQEENDKLNLLTKQFSEQLPLSVKYFTASGEAVLKSTDEIKKQIEAVKELSKEQAKLDNMKLEENINKGSEKYLKNLKKLEKAQKEMQSMQKNADVFNSSFEGEDVDISKSKAYQEAKVKEMMINQQLTGSMQEVISALQKQSLAYFEANGKMVGFTDGQISVIEKMSLMNDEFIRTAETEKEFENVTAQLVNSSVRVGEVFSEAFNIMSESIKDNPELLDELRTSLDGVANSIPDDFLKIDKNDPVGSTNRIITSVKELINISTHVKNGTVENFDALAERLMATGMTSEDAKNAVYNLANEYNNATLKAEAMKQGVDGITTATDEMNEAMLESVDVIAKVFGFENKDFSALKSQIELMEILHEKYGEGATSIDAYKEAENTLASVLGVTGDKINSNIHDYNLVFQALQDLKVITDEQGGSYLNLGEITKGMTQTQKDLVQEVLNAKGAIDGVSGVADEAGKAMGEVGKSIIDTRNLGKEPFVIEAPTIKDNGFKTQFDDVMKARQTLLDNSKSLSGIIGEVSTTGKNLANVQSDLNNVGKSADEAKQKTKDTSNTMSTSFASASKAVNDNTNKMLTKHNSQITTLNNLGSSARNAKTDISNLNSDALNSMSTLQKLQSRMNTFNAQAQSASASIEGRFSQNSINPLSFNGVSNTISESLNAFSATSDGIASGDSFGGGEGTSGIIKTPVNNFVDKFTALHNTIGANRPSSTSKSTSSSTKKKTSTTSTKSTKQSANETKKKAEELAELYVIDMLERKRVGYETTLNALNAKLKGLSENTKSYRDQLAEVYNYENEVLKVNKEDLKVVTDRNKQISKRLNELSNTKKHTKAQREEFNKLQQEYDNNLSKISSLTGTIENSIVDLRVKSESIFIDFVDEIIDSFDKSLNAITGRIDNLDFKLEVLELSDPDNVAGKIDILVDKTVELVRQRNQLEKERKQLEGDAVTAVKKYGAGSESVKKVTEALSKNQEAWEDVTISILKTEKEITDTRGKMSDKIIDLIKDNYKKMEKSATESIDKELKALKKSHDEKIKMYDDEIEKINDLYNAKIKSLDKDKEEDTYQKDKQEKIDALTELQQEEAKYSRDDTLEGRKKYAEIKKEREKAQEELDQLIKDRQLELLKEQLTNERDSLVESLENKKDAESESNDVKIESLEKEKEAISEHYSSIVDDEKRWATMREELIKGNFGTVKSELETMGMTLNQLSDGTFDTLSSNFSTYSEQVRNFVTEINNMVSQINAITNIKTPTGLTSNGNGIGSQMTPYQASEIIRKAKNGIALDNPTPDKNNLYELVKNSDIAEYTLNSIYDKASKGEAMIAPTAEKQMFYDLFLEIFGKKMPRFNTGGYTGDWSGSNGKLAILDKKELVLKEGQTSDILNAVEILSRMSNILPTPTRNAPKLDNIKGLIASAGETNNYELIVKIDNLNGDKNGANVVVKEIMKGLRKMGK